MGKALFRMLAGAAGGILASAFTEPFAPTLFGDPRWATWEIAYVTVVGACIGGLLGLATGWQQYSRLLALRGLGLGLLVGAVGGYLGHQVGAALSQLFFGDTLMQRGFDVSHIIARMLVFAPLGAFVGTVPGVASRSWPRVLQGSFGGLIGGAIGGLLFDFIGRVVGDAIASIRGGDEVGIVGRAITAVLIGALVGFLTALIESLAKSAWIRQLFGRNEYKEWIIDAPQSFIGRNERAHVPLFGDNNVMPMHAYIARQGATYTLVDGGSPIGTYLNGQRIGQALLQSGDMIQIGPFQLQFLTRDGKPQRIMGPEMIYGQQQIPAGAQPAGVPLAAHPYTPVQPMMPTQMASPATSQPTQAYPSSQAMPAATTPALAATSGPLAGQKFPISGPTEVGREATGISLSFDTMASRKHAVFSPGPQGLMVQDLGSTNGTMVNGTRVQMKALKPGDTVQIGMTVFRVE